MDLRNIPYRSEVITWNPDDLAEYFKTVSLTVSSSYNEGIHYCDFVLN